MAPIEKKISDKSNINSRSSSPLSTVFHGLKTQFILTVGLLVTVYKARYAVDLITLSYRWQCLFQLNIREQFEAV